MDFSFSEDQDAARELGAQILKDLSTHERLREVEATDSRFDDKLWVQLGDAGLLGLSIPEAQGGAGYGFLESCILAEEVGRTAAAIPVVATLVLGAAPIAAFGNDEARDKWLPGVASGETILTAALEEPGGDPLKPVTTATPDGDGWRLSGSKTNVLAGMLAHAYIVPAALVGNGTQLFVVPADAEGLTRSRQDPTEGQPTAHLDLDSVRVGADDMLASGTAAAEGAGGSTLRWLLERAEAALCVQMAGACKAAVEITARYTSERKQFGKPIAEFQAVGQRAADAFVDAEAVKLTAWQAAWRLDAGLPASAEVAVAKFWADDGAQRCVHACQHLHGGVGVDRDYPVHRYFLMVKHLALTLGGTSLSLLRLGDILAYGPQNGDIDDLEAAPASQS
ncbi:MAG: acyl-CoA dehydrogenase family protein [Acidimicrobiales bacterium]